MSDKNPFAHECFLYVKDEFGFEKCVWCGRVKVNDEVSVRS